MTTSLPEIILRYLQLAGSARNADPAEAVACFTEDAEVVDFDDVRHGRADIREWWDGPVTAFDYSLEVRGGHALGTDRYVAFTRLVGDFPGGTVDLADRFTIRAGLIAKLEIAATEPGESADASSGR